MAEESPQDVLDKEFDRMRGRLLGMIESFGLAERQESGCKQTLKALSYDAQERISKLL